MPKSVKPKPGDWVLLKGDTVVASDPDAGKIMKLADEMRDEDVVISKEPISRHCYY